MRCNEAGLKIIRDSETCKLEAYLCPSDVWTIGWGHTGPDVYEGLIWTQAQADEALAGDVGRFEAMVARALRVPVTENQFSALVSFAYNVKGWQRSTLLRKLNAGDVAGASAEFGKWVHAKGRALRGLRTRREAERRLFLS